MKAIPNSLSEFRNFDTWLTFTTKPYLNLIFSDSSSEEELFSGQSENTTTSDNDDDVNDPTFALEPDSNNNNRGKKRKTVTKKIKVKEPKVPKLQVSSSSGGDHPTLMKKGQPPPPRLVKKNVFVCHFCDIKFPNKGERFLHYETIHLEGPHDMVETGTTRLYSTICGKTSLIPGELSAHNETFHVDHFKFICTLCYRVPSRFTSLDLLKAHQVIHAAPASHSFQCLLCSKESPSPVTFSCTIDLDNHLRRVHFHKTTVLRKKTAKRNRVGPACDNPPIPIEERRRRGFFRCRFCGLGWKDGNWRGILGTRNHERKEHPEKFIHLCDHPTCGESYAEVNELLTCTESHKTSQNEEGEFKCFVCNGRSVGIFLRF